VPGREHDESVVNANAEEQEGGGEAEGNKITAGVADEPEGCQGCHAGGQQAQEADERLGAHSVRHAGGAEAEDDHDDHVGEQVGRDGVLGLLHLQGRSAGHKAADVERGSLLRDGLHGAKEGLLPLVADWHEPLFRDVQEVVESDSLRSGHGAEVIDLQAAKVEREVVLAEGVGVEGDGEGEVEEAGLDLGDEILQGEDLVIPADKFKIINGYYTWT
jgi:hypothetical protein